MTYSAHRSRVRTAASSADRPKTRVCIVSPSHLYRESLTLLLERESEIEISAAVRDAEQALKSIRLDPPDVVLVDAAGKGARTATLLLAESGALVFVAGIEEDEEEIQCWSRIGMRGYVPLSSSLGDLTRAVREIGSESHADAPSADPSEDADQGDAARCGLTPRERTIVQLLERGRSNKEIAVQLCIEIPTVKSHVHSLLQKLGASSRAEAAARARDLGL